MTSRTIALGLCVCALSWGMAARAADPSQTRYALDIPAQDLESALQAVALAANGKVLYKPELLAGKRSISLKGEYTPAEAVKALLSGTDLTYSVTPAAVILIQSAEEAAHNGVRTSLLPGVAPLAEKPRLAQTSDSSNAAGMPEGGQEADGGAQLEEIVVTGTHIRGDVKSISPIIVLDANYIRNTGYGSTSELLRSLPQNFSGGNAGATEDGRFGIGTNSRVNISSSTGVNLRGLGNTSTLVLVNGRRLAPSTYGSIADISNIPLAAIDRVEILTDGSSAIYGSDAVAGVVNILLKKNYEGAETRLRFGSVTSGSRDDKAISQLLGTVWNGGNALLSLDYQEASPLLASDRDFMRNFSDPTYIFPDTTTKAAVFNLRQDLNPRISFESNGLYARRNVRIAESRDVFGVRTDSDAQTDNIGLSAGLRFDLSSIWVAELGAQYGREDEKRHQVTTDVDGPRLDNLSDVFRQVSADVLVSGHPIELASGGVGVAFGSSVRKEEFDARQLQTQPGVPDLPPTLQDVDRDVWAGYAEVRVPIASPKQGINLIESLDLSAAIRYDDYSDFGSTTNPKIGINWSPIPALAFQASYSKSFRAPHPGQTVGEDIAPFLFVFPFDSADGTTQVPVFIVNGGSLPLQPERAKTFSAGFQWSPVTLANLRITGNYYSIRYRNRIVQPSLNFAVLADPVESAVLVSTLADDAAAGAFRDEIVNGGGQFQDFTPGGTGVTGVRFVYDIRQRNAAEVRQSGFDFGIDYSHALGRGTLVSRLNLTNIRYIDERLLPSAPAADTVDTFANPVDWRGRLDLNWSTAGWALGGALNYVDAYRNSSVAGDPPIDAWTTLDLSAQVDFGEIMSGAAAAGLVLNVSAQNVLDKDPPFVSSPLGANYDVANANPLGRFLAVELRKRW